jgi:hypothetical protein
MVYVTHIPTEESKRALQEPGTPKSSQWAACPITFDHKDRPASIRHGSSAALILDQIIDGFHLTKVLMDSGSNLNLLYQDTVRKMGIDPSRIKPTTVTFKGAVSGVEARCMGSITLEVVFGSPNNFRSEGLTFNIVPFRSSYHALLGHSAFTRFNAVPHYAYSNLKMPGPCSVIMINGNTECSLRTEERTMAAAAKVQSGLIKSRISSAVKPPVSTKQDQSISELD